jgi:hypothetical protein
MLLKVCQLSSCYLSSDHMIKPKKKRKKRKDKKKRENDAAYILKSLCSLFKELSSCEEFTACIGSRLSSLHIVLGFNCYRLIVKHWS